MGAGEANDAAAEVGCREVVCACRCSDQGGPAHRPNSETRGARASEGRCGEARATGMKTEKMLDDTFYQMMTVYLGRMDAAWLYPLNVIQWTDEMQSRDPMGNIDEVDYLVMINMSSMMLRGLGEMLQQPRNLAESWAPLARQALSEQGLLAPLEA